MNKSFVLYLPLKLLIFDSVLLRRRTVGGELLLSLYVRLMVLSLDFRSLNMSWLTGDTGEDASGEGELILE
jgi:hypothetical protein